VIWIPIATTIVLYIDHDRADKANAAVQYALGRELMGGMEKALERGLPIPEEKEKLWQLYKQVTQRLLAFEKQLGIPEQHADGVRKKFNARYPSLRREPTLSDVSKAVDDLSWDLMQMEMEAEVRADQQTRELEELREKLEEKSDGSRYRLKRRDD
jgi:hypothetical protein